MSEGKCTPRYTRDRPTIGTNTAIAATTGQRQRVGQASRTSTAASVIEPIAWPLGKLKLCSGAIDSHRLGRSRAKACLATTLSRPEPPVATATNTRSEEHTSELKSLMRISYAVLCLKNTKHK